MNSFGNLEISIIILSYNSKTDLERLLPSVFESEGVRFDSNNNNNNNNNKNKKIQAEVIVVDNGSSDGTLDWLEEMQNADFRMKNVKVIRNQNNGFAHGNNLGIKIAKGKYLLILNPDTKLERDTLKTMLKFMETRLEIGISTCKVMLPNGKLDLACRRRFPNPWNSFLRLLRISNSDYNMLDTDENASQEIDACMGAFMMVRRELKVIKSSHLRQDFGGQASRQVVTTGFTPHPSPLNPLFDQDFFMYGEDLDLCWRVKEAGHKVWYHPATFITHYKGSSSKKTPFKALKWFHQAMWIFYKKHYAQKYFFLFNWLVWLGIYSRLLGLIAINAFRRNPNVSG